MIQEWMERLKAVCQGVVKGDDTNGMLLLEYQNLVAKFRSYFYQKWEAVWDDNNFSLRITPMFDLSGRVDAEVYLMDKRKGTWDRHYIDSRLIDSFITGLMAVQGFAEDLKDKQLELPLGESDESIVNG